jgi:acetolactate synthase-1/2/3 large subunit
LLEKAERPIFYTGGGIINSGTKASKLLTKFVHETGFPITNTLMGLGGFPATDPHFIGMLGMHGTYEANMAMFECDVMLNIGARFDDRVTGRVSGFSPHSKKIHIDIDDCSINKIIRVDVPIVADAAEALEALLEEWHRRKLTNRKKAISAWWNSIKKWQEIDSLSYEKSDKIIKPGYALQRLNALTKDQKPFISTDVGQHQMWAAQYLQFDEPKKWLTSGGLGTMGYGVPAALGAQIANPESLVMCISGDASFMMNMQELATIKQYNLPVKIIILNNRYMGMVRQWQELIYEKRESQSYMESLPDFLKLAESFGIKGIECANPKELDEKFMEMISHKGPVLFNCVIEKSENVFPMIPAGSAHNEILLGSQAKLYVTKDINAV